MKQEPNVRKKDKNTSSLDDKVEILKKINQIFRKHVCELRNQFRRLGGASNLEGLANATQLMEEREQIA